MGTHSPLRSNNKRERLRSRIFNPVWPPLKLKSARSWEQPPLSSHPTTQPTTLRTRRHVAPSPTPKSPTTTRKSSTTTRRTLPSQPRTRRPWTPPSVPLSRAPTPRTPSRMPPAPDAPEAGGERQRQDLPGHECDAGAPQAEGPHAPGRGQRCSHRSVSRCEEHVE